MSLILRQAVAEDAALLFEWRNDSLTRENSENTAEVALGEHNGWFRAALSDPDYFIYLAMADDLPVGVVRAEHKENAWLLSWNIAPQWRGRGFGLEMVMAIIEKTEGLIRARIRKGNLASLKIAQAAGLIRQGEEGEMEIWELKKTRVSL
jgi:RimJ/RimL family protein N-acetyltransferase